MPRTFCHPCGLIPSERLNDPNRSNSNSNDDNQCNFLLSCGRFKWQNQRSPIKRRAENMDMPQQQNKKLIQEGFDRWTTGQGSFFDLLSDEVQWTITGNSPISKTYTSRKQFLDEVITPLSARLSKQITPTVRALFADGDTVVALWNGSAVAKDGSLTIIPTRGS